MSAPTLQVIVGSTRPGRVGRPVAEWFTEVARDHGGFDVELVDLAEVGLPLFDEPRHPRLRRYEHDHTKAWSATIERSDALVFVIPEYNHGFNAAVKNAIDFLFEEWQHKPVGVVSYGGVAGGTRALQMLKPVLVALKMVPVVEAVNIPFVAKVLDEERQVQPTEVMQTAATTMLDSLARWTEVMQGMRSRPD